MEMQNVRGIWLPASDTHFPRMIAKGPLLDGRGTYQLPKLTAAVALCKQRRAALDIGAHVGLWSRVLARQFEEVQAFEASPEHVACFERNLEGIKNTHVFTGAVGANDQASALRMCSANSGNAHILCAGEADFEEAIESVLMITIDSFMACVPSEAVAQRIDFVKIDVEGYEYDVLMGARQTIERNRPVMVVEQKPGNAERYRRKTGDAIDLLKSWGARTMWEKSGDYCLSWE